MVKVKICGITNLEDAIASVDAGAEFLGFNFYKESKRYVSPEHSLEIVNAIRWRVEKVGVFVNESIDSVLKISNDVGLDAIQLHGDEDIPYLTKLKHSTHKKIIKAFRIAPHFDVEEILSWPWDFPLFDAYSPTEYGGTGRSFDWDDFGFQIYLTLPCSAFVAGGLNPENVAEAVRATDAYAVDVASGVESSPGKKDPKKLEAFIRNAKNA